MIEINIDALFGLFWQIMLWSWIIVMPIRTFEWITRRDYKNLFVGFIPEGLFIFPFAPYLLVRYLVLLFGNGFVTHDLMTRVAGLVSMLVDDKGEVSYGFLLNILAVDEEYLHETLVCGRPIKSVFVVVKLEMVDYCVHHFPRATRKLVVAF